jgi:two-component system sensor histidine kinase KdpD
MTTEDSQESGEDGTIAADISGGLRGYSAALAIVAACTTLNWALSIWFAPTNLAMIYLLGVVLAATKFGRGASIVCASTGVIAFDFFFVPPVFTLRFGDTQYLLTAIVLLLVGLIVSSLAAHLKLQAKAATQAALAAQEERLRNSLLASISHDLRTPLAVIVGGASHLLESANQLPPQEQQRLLKNLYDEAHYVSRVVSDLLDMTRLQSGPVQLDRQWYPLEELVGAALQRTQSQLARHQVCVHLPEQLPMIRVDGVLVEKLLINLLENAGKYTPPGTAIDISAERRTGEIAIEVADSGAGIPADAAERLFEKFYRGTTEGPIAGVGLGLTICRAIAQAHGGSIRARNRREGGAIFTVSLPYEVPPVIPIEATL